MTTNGVLLNKHMDFLVKHNFEVMISLDGGKHNNSYRVFHNGKSSFEVIIKNLNLLKSTYPDFFEKVAYNAVLHNRNSVTEVYNYFKKKLVKYH